MRDRVPFSRLQLPWPPQLYSMLQPFQGPDPNIFSRVLCDFETNTLQAILVIAASKGFFLSLAFQLNGPKSFLVERSAISS